LKLAHLLVEAEYKQNQFQSYVEENEKETKEICEALIAEGFIVK